jgi:lambda family phage tail tape measure protein
MADLVYKVSVDTKQAQKSLDNLDKSIGGLKNALAGLAIGSFIANTYRTAQAVNDLSEQTGFAVQTILGLNKAFIENGSDAQGAASAILKLTQNVGEALNKNENLKNSFDEVGVSLDDLKKLSTEEIFLKTVDGLGKITDISKQARLSIDLLGKNARVNFAGLAKDTRPAIQGSLEQARATIEADRAAKSFQRAVKTVGDELLKVLEPLNTFIGDLKLSGEAVKGFIDRAVAIGTLILTFTALGKIIGGIRTAITLLTTSWTQFVAVLLAIPRTIGIIVYAFQRLFGIIVPKNPKKSILQILSDQFPIVGKQVGELITAFGILGGVIAGAFSFINPKPLLDGLKSIGQALEIIPNNAEASANAIKRMNEESFEAHKRSNRLKEDEREYISAVQEKIAAIREIGISYQKQNNEIIKAVENEKRYLALSNEQVELERALDDLRLKFVANNDQLVASRNKLTAAQKEERQAINDTIVSTFRAFLADEKRLKTAIENLQKAKQAEEELARSVENTARELQKLSALADLQEELSLIGLYGDELEKQTRLNEINRNLRQEQQQLAIELLRLDRDRTKIGELNYNAERQRIIKQMADAVELSEARIATFEEEQKRKTELENSYAEGAKRALQDMAEQMKPLTVAQDAVKRGFDALGNAIDDFVETGKFSFKQFAASVIADIAKIVAKALVLQAIKTIFGGFGIPGLAEGGPAKAGKPYIVGEKGPELFVPKTSGTVVPNNAMKNGVATGAVNAPVTNNYNTYNINAVDAKSVAQLFAENRKVLLGTVKMAERELPYMA